MAPLWWAGPLALDEHGSYWVIDSDLPGSTLERSLNYAAIPPLSGWLQQLSLRILGKTELTFRLPSAICTLLAVLVIYRTGLAVGGPIVGGIAALILSMHPEAVDEARIARCYGTVLLMSSLLLLATLSWQRHPRSLWRALGWSLTATGLLWTHYTSVLLVAICGAVLVISRGFQKPAARGGPWILLTGAGLAVLLNLPLIPSVLRLRDWSQFLNFSPPGNSILAAFGAFWWAGFPAACAAGLVLGRADRQPRAMRQGDLWLLGAASLLPVAMLAVLSSGEISSLANPRYRVAFAPAGACFAAALLTSVRGSRGAVVGGLALLGVSWWLSPLTPWTMGRLGHPADQDWWYLNAYLAENAREGEPILVQGGLAEAAIVPAFAHDRLFQEYVACRAGRFYLESRHPRYAVPLLWNPTLGTAPAMLEIVSSWPDQPPRCWLACATDTDLNRFSQTRMAEILTAAGFVAQEPRTWPHATLTLFERPQIDRAASGKSPE